MTTSSQLSASYLNWNDRLTEKFFNSEMADRPVYLYATSALISQVGESIGEEFEDFIAAVKQGPPWVDHGKLCQRTLQTMEGWRERDLPFPPYVAYLALFVLAAGTEADVAAHAYYPRLRQILGYPDGGVLPSFDRMLKPWSDLEKWANDDKDGTLGVFTAQISGGWIHVGLPIAQTLLSEHERKGLPEIFARAELDPTSAPPTAELARSLQKYGPGKLRNRTLKLLNTPADSEMCSVLLDTVADELFDWDGHVDETESGAAKTTRHFALARLCLVLDTVANQARISVRVRINQEFPEGKLLLKVPGETQAKFECEESVHKWSTPLQRVDDVPLDGKELDWLDGVLFKEERLGWHFKLQGRQVRILAKGIGEGLPGLVEIQALPRSESFYLLYSPNASEKLLPWLEGECRDVRSLSGLSGLPDGWQMTSVGEACSDSIRKQFPFLSFSNRIRVRFSGGVRSSAGNNFFVFAPPAIVLDGKKGNEEVICNGERIMPVAEIGDRYELPPNLPTEKKILIQVKTGDRTIRRSLGLIGDFTWAFSEPIRIFDGWGRAVNVSSSEAATVAGVVVSGKQPDTSHFRRPLRFTTTLESLKASARVLYVGRHLGEIVSWPSERLPEDWSPVWVIPMARRGQAFYCGEDPSAELPSGEKTGGKDKRDMWKTVLWYKRKRITPPMARVLKMLWHKFVEVARNA